MTTYVITYVACMLIGADKQQQCTDPSIGLNFGTFPSESACVAKQEEAKEFVVNRFWRIGLEDKMDLHWVSAAVKCRTSADAQAWIKGK
ncbi:hypothetical protein AL527_14370 [Pseudomonas fulva]|nr:hypothetical protein AL527_14370 [Pseudomonas fulva]